MYNRDGPVCSIDRAQEGKSDGMVSTKCDNSRKRPFILCWTFLLGVGCWRAGQDGVVTFFDLMKCPSIVVSDKISFKIYPEARFLGVLTMLLGYLHNLEQ